ncbi:hypothetical protein JL720_5865 [Aureococcus anophagefferens]|nr:hypothetical protein JL720_5865 [Aureococcus anophagefferens]
MRPAASRAAPWLWLAAAARVASPFSTRAMYAELDRSLERYAAVESADAAFAYLKDLIERPEHSYHNTLFVLDGVVYCDRRFLATDKNNKHVAMVGSLAALGVDPPNVVYRFIYGAEGYNKGDALARHPVLVIAKYDGYGDAGVLAPNPYFLDLRAWDEERRRILAKAHARPYGGRDGRVFWRGEIASHDSDAASLTLAAPARVDVRCVSRHSCRPRDAARHPCAAYPYDGDMARAANRPKDLVDRGGFVDLPEYTRYQKVLNLPGEDDGFTHLAVNKSSLLAALDAIDALPDANRTALRVRAKEIDDRVVSGKGIAAYFGALFDRLRARFSLGAVLDDPCARARLFRAANCSALDLVAVAPAAESFFKSWPGGPGHMRRLDAARVPAAPTDNAIYKRGRARPPAGDP